MSRDRGRQNELVGDANPKHLTRGDEEGRTGGRPRVPRGGYAPVYIIDDLTTLLCGQNRPLMILRQSCVLRIVF